MATFTNDLKELKVRNLLSKSIVVVDRITESGTEMQMLDQLKQGVFYLEMGKNNIHLLQLMAVPTKKEDILHAFYCPYIAGNFNQYGIGYVDVPYKPETNEPHFVFTATMTGCEFAAFYLNETHFRVYHIQSPDTNGRPAMLEWIKNSMRNDQMAERGDIVGEFLTSLSYAEYAGEEEIKSEQFSTMVFLYHMNGSWWFISQFQLVNMSMQATIAQNPKEMYLYNRETGHVAVKKLTQGNIATKRKVFNALKKNAEDSANKKILKDLFDTFEAILSRRS